MSYWIVTEIYVILLFWNFLKFMSVHLVSYILHNDDWIGNKLPVPPWFNCSLQEMYHTNGINCLVFFIWICLLLSTVHVGVSPHMYKHMYKHACTAQQFKKGALHLSFWNFISHSTWISWFRIKWLPRKSCSHFYMFPSTRIVCTYNFIHILHEFLWFPLMYLYLCH